MKAIHLINQPWYIHAAVKALTPLLKTKIGDRVSMRCKQSVVQVIPMRPNEWSTFKRRIVMWPIFRYFLPSSSIFMAAICRHYTRSYIQICYHRSLAGTNQNTTSCHGYALWWRRTVFNILAKRWLLWLSSWMDILKKLNDNLKHLDISWVFFPFVQR